jgi:hypothetical protein
MLFTKKGIGAKGGTVLGPSGDFSFFLIRRFIRDHLDRYRKSPAFQGFLSLFCDSSLFINCYPTHRSGMISERINQLNYTTGHECRQIFWSLSARSPNLPVSSVNQVDSIAAVRILPLHGFQAGHLTVASFQSVFEVDDALARFLK